MRKVYKVLIATLITPVALVILLFSIICIWAWVDNETNPERIHSIALNASISKFKDVDSDDIDYLLKHLDKMLSKDIDTLDEILEETNRAKQADLIMDLEEKLHTELIRDACIVLSVDIVKAKMSPTQRKDLDKAEKKLSSLKRRLALLKF